MRGYYQSLAEKDRRRYAALEAQRLGHGGVTYVSRVLGCSAEAIEHGKKELDALPHDPLGNRQRRPGAGRPKTEQRSPEIVPQIQAVIQERTAGDPMSDRVWTDLTPREISAFLPDGLAVGARVIQRVVRDILGYGQRQIAKVLPGGHSADRDAQFQYIARLREQFFAAGNPVFSLDTKKKEFLGNLYRNGRVYCLSAQRAFDHDFPTWADGVIVPHGIYDLQRNHGWLHLGLSRETTEFACDSFRLFWEEDGSSAYPDASEILALSDGGGSNSCRKHIFKEDLQVVVNRIGIPIRVAHYPAYCSKYNPIERRLFCHVTRACQGVLFDSLRTVVDLMKKTSTRKGLSVTVRVIEKMYATGRKVSEEFKRQLPTTIDFDDFLPKWNYRVVPQST
jgi:hypothetical protein